MARVIIDWEARRDAKGRIKVYALPANDGGGSYEYAGINDRYHPAALKEIRRLLSRNQYGDAEEAAAAYIAKYTDSVGRLTTSPAVELFLRDCAWNRGPTGAVKILQMALNVKPDGKVGPITRHAIDDLQANPSLFLERLRKARETYENIIAPGRANLRAGLINRWDKALAESQELLAA